MADENHTRLANSGTFRKKCVMIILDGLGDRSYEQFDGKTPLQAAHTPVLDRLASGGAVGLYHASALGQALPSEQAHFIMFGYDLAQFPGRGALEALGAGLDLTPSQVAILSHFASLKEENGCLHLVNGKPKAGDKEARELIQAVCEFEAENRQIRFYPTGGLRGVLCLDGDASPHITDSDPILHDRPLVELAPWEDFAQDRAARHTCRMLKTWLINAHERLTTHPVNVRRAALGVEPINGLVTQRAGRLKAVPPFKQQYGLAGLSIASGIVYHGLSRYVGMDAFKATDSGDAGGDLAQRLSIARQALDRYDFIHVHTKTPDEAAHTKNPEAKKAVIESLDRGIGQAIGPLLDRPDVLVVIGSDHSTPSAGPLVHSGEPCPLLFHGPGVRRDTVKRFDEIHVGAGALGTVRGLELMLLILNHLDMAKLAGLMDSPVDQPFWPGDYQPFRI